MDVVGRWRRYYYRGHEQFGGILNLVTAATVYFGLIPWVTQTFGRFRFFALTFIPFYLLVATVGGWLDMWIGTYKGENIATTWFTPQWQLLLECEADNTMLILSLMQSLPVKRDPAATALAAKRLRELARWLRDDAKRAQIEKFAAGIELGEVHPPA